MTAASDMIQEADALPAGGKLAQLADEYLWVLIRESPQYPSGALLRCWELAWLTGLELPGPLLDLGCGDGRILARLLARREPGARPDVVYGLDVNASSATLAAQQGLYRGVVVADARTMPVRTAGVGGVVSVCVLEHISKVQQVLSEVARVLQPGGRFVFSVPTVRLLAVGRQCHPEDPEGWARAFCERIEQVTTWEPARWTAALTETGLCVRGVHGFMPEAAARAWFASYDWVVRPIRGRGALYRAAGPDLRRFGLGRLLAGYWYRRLSRWARQGVTAPVDEACAVVIVADQPGGERGVIS